MSHAGKALATCEEVQGVLLLRGAKEWQAVKKGESIPAEALLFALPEAKIHSANGAVSVEMKADISQRGPMPALESAIQLHSAEEVDLDITLDRGILVFRNLRKEGNAKVLLRLHDSKIELALRPGSRIGVEMYSRYAPGIIKEFTGKLEAPSSQALALVLEGKVFVRTAEEGFTMQAPPGPALFQWDNFDKKVHVQGLEKLPDFIRPMTEMEKETFAKAVKAAQTLAGGDRKKAIAALLSSKEPVARLTGVVAAGALGDVGLVLQSVENKDHPELREQSIVVMRHYLGRGPDQVRQTMKQLMTLGKVGPIKASVFIELLLGFTAEQKKQPVTYDILIKLLDHTRLGIRELAHWHLVRLVPVKTPIAYNAAASEGDREKAIAQWRALVPRGKGPAHLNPK